MESRRIHEHWSNWAATYGTGLRATTKTRTAKALEIDALCRRLNSLLGDKTEARALEVGCGNGINCVALAKALPNMRFDGVDYVPDMVAAARENGRAGGVEARLRFFVGDALHLDEIAGLGSAYDLVFTDRCLVNLNTVEQQKLGITALAAKLRRGGHLLMIENSLTTYGKQNRLRELLGLPPRQPADFNLFFDETEIRPHIRATGLELIDVEDFLSLHDLMLYVLVPAINGGAVDYEHPLVQAAAKLNQEMSATEPGGFGAFGQNRLFVCRNPL
ncbi:MAG TPA: class I SAM-dependent methyltransferase [Stellaceae bacterium]|nr:class I SAM-dependent methyltransferase [Stellaceae bacterium]